MVINEVKRINENKDFHRKTQDVFLSILEQIHSFSAPYGIKVHTLYGLVE